MLTLIFQFYSMNLQLGLDVEYYPLTENQLGIYYECIQNPDEISYVIPTVTRFDNGIDPQKLKQAVIKTIEAHPYLKTRIVMLDDGSVKQKRNDDIAIDEIEIVKVDAISNDELAENDVCGFALDGEQLFKFKIYETPDETVLFANFHHIITDGIAQDNLFNEIMDVYGGKELPEEQVDGYVYSLIEEKLVNSEKYELSKKFFHDRLSQEIDSTVLP